MKNYPRNKQSKTQNQNQQQQQKQQATAAASSSNSNSTTTTTTTNKTNEIKFEPENETITMFIANKNSGASFQVFNPNTMTENSTMMKPPVPLNNNSSKVQGYFGDCKPLISPCSTMIAFADAQHVYVHSNLDATQILKYEVPRIINLSWSPQSTFLVCYAHHDAVRSADNNMAVLRVSKNAAENTSSSCCVLRCGQALFPALYWSSDEKVVARRSNQNIVVVKGDLSDMKTNISTMQLSLPKIVGKEASIAVSSSPTGPPFLCCFIPQIKTQVSSVNVYRLPEINSQQSILNRPFGRGDRATCTFSNVSASSILVLIRCDDDKTGASYYGSTNLHVVDVGSRSSVQIPLAEGEGIHDVSWCPSEDVFLAVHGIMPRNKATLFSAKGEPLWKFGEAPRNSVHWSPSGTTFALGGTGGLPGDWTFHCRSDVGKTGCGDGKIGSISEKTSHQVWLPNSRYFAVYNLFGTLKVDNKVKIFKYNGELEYEQKFPSDELHSVLFAPQKGSMDSMKSASQRPFKSPVRNVEKVQEKVGAWKPRNQSAAAAALLALPNQQSGSAPKPSGPVGAVLAAPTKKKGRR